MYLQLVAWALQGISELCLPLGNVTVCAGMGIGLIVQTTGKKQTEGVNRVISRFLGTFLQE